MSFNSLIGNNPLAGQGGTYQRAAKTRPASEPCGSDSTRWFLGPQPHPHACVFEGFLRVGAEICKKSRRGIDKLPPRCRGGRGYAQRPRPGPDGSTFELARLRKVWSTLELGCPERVGVVHAVD